MKLYLTLCFITLSSAAFSQSGWKLIYANDANGKTAFGQLGHLMEAVRAGKDVKLGWNMGGGDIIVEHTAEVQFLSIMDSVVYAQISPIIGQKPGIEEQQMTFHENLQWSMIASTNGKNDTIMRDIVSGKILGHTIYRWNTRWFVRD